MCRLFETLHETHKEHCKCYKLHIGPWQLHLWTADSTIKTKFCQNSGENHGKHCHISAVVIPGQFYISGYFGGVRS